MEIIDHPSPHVYKAIEWMKEKCPRYGNDKVSSTDGKCKDRDIRLAFYDLETGGFGKDADLLQVCFHCNGVDDLDLHIMPEKGIEPSVTKVHRLSVSCSTEEKRLVNCKGELKDTVTVKYAASKIVEFVKQVMSGDTPVILVAHNDNSFDHDRLLSFPERNHELYELSESFPETLFFGDSLPTVRKLKTKPDLLSWKLSDVYRKFFAEDFTAHDAVADVTARGRIIFHSPSATILQSGIKSTCKSL